MTERPERVHLQHMARRIHHALVGRRIGHDHAVPIRRNPKPLTSREYSPSCRKCS